MVSNVEACAECAQNCRLIHRTAKDPSSIVVSFFKVMIGDDYSEVLFLPPKFSRRITALVGFEIKLEDSSGEHWLVTLSEFNGSLAFQEGWHEFAVDHGLKVGDLLVFNFVMGSHFIVQIYGRSGCYELRHIDSYGIPKKRARIEGDFIGTEVCQHQIANASKALVSKKENQRQQHDTFSQVKCCEEPFYMVDRWSEHMQEDRSSLYDLSMYEIPSHHPCDANQSSLYDLSTDEIPNHRPCGANGIKRTSGGGERTKDRNSLFDLSASEIPNQSLFDANGMRTSDGGEGTKERRIEKELQTCTGTPAENGKKNVILTRESVRRKQVERRTHHPKSEANGIAEGDLAFSLAGEDDDTTFEVVKAEPVDWFETTHREPDAAGISCSAVVGNGVYLELPTSFTSTISKRAGLESKVMLLRGPDERVWPVLYSVRCGIKILSSGWEAFRKANRVRPGDQCVFELENESESIYSVRVVTRR